jgi:molybdopterin converting factor small subunit
VDDERAMCLADRREDRLLVERHERPQVDDLRFDAIRGELLRGLEREHPAVAGWILDERGLIRRHINVFVNGERGGEATAVGADDRIEVLPAISGG